MDNIGTLRQFEILLKVHELNSVTKAAEQLFLTQPSVTMQLNKLQESVGLELTYQQGRQIKFTKAGEIIAERAKRLMTDYEDLARELALLKNAQRGELALGLVTTAKYFIPHLVGEFIKYHPEIDLQFNLGNREQIINRVNEDFDDFYVFSHPPVKDELAMTPIMSNRLRAIAPLDHPLSQQETITLEEFCQYPIIMRESGSGTKHAIDEFFANQSVNLNVRMTIESNEAIKHAVMSGLGLGIISEHVLSYGGNQGIKILDIEGFNIKSKWYLVYRKTRPLSPIGQAFISSLQNFNNK